MQYIFSLYMPIYLPSCLPSTKVVLSKFGSIIFNLYHHTFVLSGFGEEGATVNPNAWVWPALELHRASLLLHCIALHCFVFHLQFFSCIIANPTLPGLLPAPPSKPHISPYLCFVSNITTGRWHKSVQLLLKRRVSYAHCEGGCCLARGGRAIASKAI